MATPGGADTLFRIGGDYAGLKKAAKGASGILSRLGKSAQRHTKLIAKIGTVADLVGVAIGINLVNKARQAIDEQAKLSQQLDTTYRSLSTLTRGGELSGVTMNQISTASRTLAVRMGEAQQGLASAEDAFTALQIDAKALADLPLDQRLEKINTALTENVDKSQRAAIAADLFGTRSATAIQQLTPEVLKTARQEIEKYGQALSDVDAAKVEAANDALSGVGNVLKGAVTQITVRVAPVIEALSKQFIETATAGSSIGEKADEAFGFIVNSTAFVIDAIEGVKRVFASLGDIATVVGTKIGDEFFNFSETVNNTLAKVTTGGLKEFFQQNAQTAKDLGGQMRDTMDESFDAIHNRLMEPLPSEAFKEFVKEAQDAAEASAQAVVDARDSVAGITGGGEIDEQRREKLQQQVEQLRNATLTESEILQEKYQRDLEALREARENEIETKIEYDQLEKNLGEKLQSELSAIEKNASDKRKADKEAEEEYKAQLVEDGLNKATTLMNSGSRKLFEIGKAASISQAVIKTRESATRALGDLPWPLNLAVAAANLAYGFQQVRAIKKQQFGGGGAGAAATGSNTAAVNAQSQTVGQQQQQTLGVVRISGFNPNQNYRGSEVEQTFNQFRKYMADGARDLIWE